MAELPPAGTDEYMELLQEKQYAVDLNKVAEITVNKPRFIPADILRRIMRFAVVQALYDALTATEAALSIRNLHPRDFVITRSWDAALHTEKITKEEWEQQPRQAIANCRTFPYPGDKEVCVYEYNMTSGNRNKVTVLYGFEDLSIDGIVNVKNIDIYRGNRLKLLDRLDTDLLTKQGFMFMTKPYLFKKSDDFLVYFQLKKDAAGKRDFIAFHGIVCEPLGAS